MANQPEPVAGAIFDLGYRGYTGRRLGRSYALATLYVYSLRGTFGIGRRLAAKVFPFGLAVVLALPAVIQLGIASVASQRFTLVKPENYFSLVEIILALFCAAVAPELLGRDRRTRTLPLYFSRALTRSDYAAAKLGALFSALFLVAIVPQTLLFAGNALASNDSLQYVVDNLGQVPPILASAAAMAIFLASVSLAIAAQTERRAYATGGVLAAFVLLSVLAGILIRTTSSDVQRYLVLLDPLSVVEGLTFWLFGAAAAKDSNIAIAHLPGFLYLLTLAGVTGAALVALYHRYQRIPA